MMAMMMMMITMRMMYNHLVDILLSGLKMRTRDIEAGLTDFNRCVLLTATTTRIVLIPSGVSFTVLIQHAFRVPGNLLIKPRLTQRPRLPMEIKINDERSELCST